MKFPHVSEPYAPPAWAQGSFTHLPTDGRLRLANLPTPLYPLHLESLAPVLPLAQHLLNLQCSLWIKRDDASGGVELGGNKIRKLEFLLAQALAKKADSVVTIGGEQSNHCRATAAACRMVGLEPHLILRTAKADDDQNDLGLIGNLLMDRMVGSTIYMCTPGEYGRLGSRELVKRVCDHLHDNESKKPYDIPVGGSNGLGTWGYIEAVDELMQQMQGDFVDHVFFACGSGGTAAGIALGLALYYKDNEKRPQVHAMGVCDSPDYFYRHVASIADEMGIQQSECETTEAYVRKSMVVHQSKGLGYAVSTPNELELVATLARATGVVLDPVYSGKAFYNFLDVVQRNPEAFQGKNALFWHTGGALGLYDKCTELTLAEKSPCCRLDIYGKSKGIDISAAGGKSS